jgi:uncharacterized protein
VIKKIALFVTKYPVLVLILVILAVGLMGSGVRKVEMDENIKEMLPKDLASRQALNELEDVYGGSDVILLALHHKDGIFNPETLNLILDATDSLETMDGIVRATSLSTVKEIKGFDWGLQVEPFIEYEIESDEEAEEIRTRFFDDETYLGELVSDDGKWTAVTAVLSEDADPMVVLGDLRRFVGNFEGETELYIAGMPVIQQLVSANMKGDLKRLIPFVSIVVVLILFISIRTVSGTLLPLIVALMSVVSMVGMMGHLGRMFMVVNNVMPVILIAVGISYAIHIIVGYYDEIEHKVNKKEAIINTMEHVGKPVLLAGLTTIIGFITMLSAPLPVYAEFGLILAFGVFVCTILTILFVPAVLTLLPIPKHLIHKSDLTFLDRLLIKLGEVVPKRRKEILIIALIVTTIFAFGIPKLELDMNTINFFDKKSEIRVADDLVNRHLGGSSNLNVLFKGDAQSPEVLNAMDDLEQYVESFPETGAAMSLATAVKKINRMLNADDPAMEIIPETSPKIAQSILAYETSSSPEDFEAFVDNSYENAQVVARMQSVSTRRISVIANSINSYLEDNYSHLGEIRMTGFVVFLKDLAKLIVTAQIRSLILSTLLIAILVTITFKSYKIGLMSIIPILMTVVVNFGLMGITGIALSIPTAMISSIIIGIGVDFSLHFLSRFKLEISRGVSSNEAVSTAIRRVGKPILFDATPTALGFMVLLVSGFLPVKYMGMLIALTMMICAISALTVLAAAATFIKK